MRKNDVKIEFGIIDGFNQAQARAQFVANVADYGFDIQEALEAGRFAKPTLRGATCPSNRLVPKPRATRWRLWDTT